MLKFDIRHGDNIRIAIWKFMADYKKYTSKEVSEGLARLGLPERNIQIRVCQLYHEGWFDTIDSFKGKRKIKLYQLKPSIKIPMYHASKHYVN